MYISGDIIAMKLALCQLDSCWEDPDGNRESFSRAVDIYVAERGAPDLLVFPEFFNTAFTFNLDYAEPCGGPTLCAMLDAASRAGCAVAGSILVKDGGKAFNRLYFVTEKGEVFQYDKRHAFSFSGEDKVISCGRSKTVVDYRGWNIGLSVCYDLRFPVWLRNEGNAYDLLLNVASWPASRSVYATMMASSRAIENMCYVAFCNRVGSDPECDYDGRSNVWDFGGAPLGRVMEIDGRSFVEAEIDRAALTDYREKFPIWKDNDRFTIEL